MDKWAAALRGWGVDLLSLSSAQPRLPCHRSGFDQQLDTPRNEGVRLSLTRIAARFIGGYHGKRYSALDARHSNTDHHLVAIVLELIEQSDFFAR
jgi:hypothetical protein